MFQIVDITEKGNILTVSRGGLQHCGDVLRPLWLLVAEFVGEFIFWILAFKGVETWSSSVVSMSTSSSEFSSLLQITSCAAVSTNGGPRITGRNADWCKGLTGEISGSARLEPLIGGGRGPEINTHQTWQIRLFCSNSRLYVTKCVCLFVCTERRLKTKHPNLQGTYLKDTGQIYPVPVTRIRIFPCN